MGFLFRKFQSEPSSCHNYMISPWIETRPFLKCVPLNKPIKYLENTRNKKSKTVVKLPSGNFYAVIAFFSFQITSSVGVYESGLASSARGDTSSSSHRALNVTKSAGGSVVSEKDKQVSAIEKLFLKTLKEVNQVQKKKEGQLEF